MSGLMYGAAAAIRLWLSIIDILVHAATRLLFAYCLTEHIILSRTGRICR